MQTFGRRSMDIIVYPEKESPLVYVYSSTRFSSISTHYKMQMKHYIVQKASVH